MRKLTRHSRWRQAMLTLLTILSLAACHVAPNKHDTPTDNARSGKVTEIIVLGTIHSAHLYSKKYSLDRIRGIVKDIDPDIVITELPRASVRPILASYKKTGRVTDSRALGFPEYTQAVIPLHDRLGFWLVGASDWNQKRANMRATKLAAVAHDPKRADEWDAYQEALADYQNAVSGRSDDPLFIHSTAYDTLTDKAHRLYIKYFHSDLGANGWAALNREHTANIMQTLDSVHGEGKRVLIMYGAEHKYWILRELAKRKDVKVISPIRYFTQNPDKVHEGDFSLPDPVVENGLSE